jgi:hypothetical protein
MAGLVPAIHAVWPPLLKMRSHALSPIPEKYNRLHRVDGRDKPGHDGVSAFGVW